MIFFENPLILSALLSLVLSQIFKVLINLFFERKWSPGRMTETGGMPSSHSAMVACLCTTSGLYYGIESPFFAISLVFGIIVIYDATGIRRAAGRHAEILNEFLKEFSHLFEEEKRPKALKTLLGHSYPQVLAGLLLGAVIGVIIFQIIPPVG